MTAALNEARITFVGGGNMGGALLAGLLRSGVAPAAVTVCDPSAAVRTRLETQFGVVTAAAADAAARAADLLVLAVKPQLLREVVRGLRLSGGATRPLVLSVAAGIRVADLERWCGPGVPVVRAMPNRPALIGAGAAGLYAPPSVSDAERRLAEATMRAVGVTAWVAEESLIDAVTALSGSGPAYFFLLAELMTEAAIQQGLDPATARTLCQATLAGAGALAAASGADMSTLRAEVTSPGGTTEAALRSLGQADLRAIVQRALAAAADRARELAQPQPDDHSP
jgi:pyrroline-5-carboxylate reductase